MLSGISWNNYIVVVVLLSMVWYLFVGFRYYFEEIKDLISGKRKFQFRGLIGSSIPKKDYDFDYQKSDEILNTQVEFEIVDTDFNEVEDLVTKLKNAIIDATQKKLVKKEFEDHIRLILKECPALGNSPFRFSLNELIISECEKQESVLLTPQEVDALWE